MSTPAMVQQDAATIRHRQLGVVIALGLGLVALGLLFNAEIAAATGTWIESTAYNHCFLVIPIAAYLAWDRRNDLRGVAAVPMPLAALAGIPVALAWLLAERLGIMEGRQLMAITFVEVLALAVFGWRLWWMLCGPLLYFYFLVPFGAFLTPKLQDITTVFVQHGLNVLHIPAYIDGYTIEIPEGTFYIAEACAGLRFLIASIAFGCLYALLMYRSPIRRTVFIVASIIVPIIANGMRAVGIVALGHLLGSAQAAATDHVLYGWIFFSLVILLLIALGLPFREDADRMAAARAPRPVPMAPGNGQWRSAALAGGLVVVVAALSPALAAQLDRMRPPIAASIPPLVLGPDCADVPLDSPAPLDARGAMVKRRVACDGMVFDVTLDVFAARSTAAPVLAVAHALGRVPNPTNDDEIVTEIHLAAAAVGPAAIVVAEPHHAARANDRGRHLGGRPTGGGWIGDARAPGLDKPDGRADCAGRGRGQSGTGPHQVDAQLEEGDRGAAGRVAGAGRYRQSDRAYRYAARLRRSPGHSRLHGGGGTAVPHHPGASADRPTRRRGPYGTGPCFRGDDGIDEGAAVPRHPPPIRGDWPAADPGRRPNADPEERPNADPGEMRSIHRSLSAAAWVAGARPKPPRLTVMPLETRTAACENRSDRCSRGLQT